MGTVHTYLKFKMARVSHLLEEVAGTHEKCDHAQVAVLIVEALSRWENAEQYLDLYIIALEAIREQECA